MRRSERSAARLPRNGATCGWTAQGRRAKYRGNLAATTFPNRRARRGTKCGGLLASPRRQPGSAFQKAFESALRKCGVRAGRGAAVYRREVTSSLRNVETVLPNARDRRIHALRLVLGQDPLFYEASYRSEDPGRLGRRSFTSIWTSADR